MMVLTVFIFNVQCALQFIFLLYDFIGCYELVGVGGRVALQGIGVAFLCGMSPILLLSSIR